MCTGGDLSLLRVRERKGQHTIYGLCGRFPGKSGVRPVRVFLAKALMQAAGARRAGSNPAFWAFPRGPSLGWERMVKGRAEVA